MQRFWNKVEKTNYCWNWIASTTRGYGKIKYKGKMYLAHRFAWFLTHGKCPNQWLLHACDNPRCVNIDHLFEGTAKDNSLDMHAKGRGLTGEKHPKAKLAEIQVLEIRRKFEPNTYASRKLAKEYGVDRNVIKDIISKKTWKHI